MTGRDGGHKYKNECSREQAIAMLVETQGVSTFFRGFTLRDIESIVEFMDFFRVAPDTPLLVCGERHAHVCTHPCTHVYTQANVRRSLR